MQRSEIEMSEIPSSSVVELTTDVNSTVEHLKELGKGLSEQCGFAKGSELFLHTSYSVHT